SEEVTLQRFPIAHQFCTSDFQSIRVEQRRRDPAQIACPQIYLSPLDFGDREHEFLSRAGSAHPIDRNASELLFDLQAGIERDHLPDSWILRRISVISAARAREQK